MHLMILEIIVLAFKLCGCIGVRNRSRTYNFLLVGQALSQLSYTNILKSLGKLDPARNRTSYLSFLSIYHSRVYPTMPYGGIDGSRTHNL